MKRTIVILPVLYFAFTAAWAQADWTYAAGKDQIRVYSKTLPDSRIKALKAECVMEAGVAEVLALLMDVPAAVDWMCHTRSSVLVRKVSDTEIYTYTEVDLPWPLDNRDFVTHMSVSTNPESGIVTVDAPAVPGSVPARKGLVRISHSQSVWKIIPAGHNKVKLEYTLRVDPGGMIPAHVVNYFARQAPIETFTKMQKELRERRGKRVSGTSRANRRGSDK